MKTCNESRELYKVWSYNGQWYLQTAVRVEVFDNKSEAVDKKYRLMRIVK